MPVGNVLGLRNIPRAFPWWCECPLEIFLVGQGSVEDVISLRNLCSRRSIHQTCVRSRKSMLEICLVMKCPMGKCPTGKFPGMKNKGRLSFNWKGSA